MRASDISWGGSLNIEVTFAGEIPQGLESGVTVKFDFESTSQKYYLVINGARYGVMPSSKSNKYILDEYAATQDIVTPYIARILDINNNVSNSSIAIKISSFNSQILLSELNAMYIKISEKVADSVPKNQDALDYLREVFIFIDERKNNNIFVTGISEHDSHSKGKSFTIVSGKKRLTIAKINNEFVAVSLTNQIREIYAPVSVLSGSVDFIDNTKNAKITQEQANRINDVIDKADSYLKTWEIYNELERRSIRLQAKEYGVSQYDSYSYEIKSSIIYKFHLKSNDFEMLTDDLELDVTLDSEILNDDALKDLNSDYVGHFMKIDGNTLYLVDKTGDSPKDFPKKNGYLFKSITGDRKRMKRREDAKDSIATGAAPLPGLFRVINEGVTNSTNYNNRPAITEEVKRKIKDKNGNPIEFNEKQKQAIKIAINSPDIALIQGPPGTGKTTVIKTIIARFEEIYKKENNGRFPRILVTSFQHEAVENAIENLDFSGFPAIRMGGKRGEENRHLIEINKWIEKRSNDIDKFVSDYSMPAIYKDVAKIKDAIFAWYCKGKPSDEGVEILKRYSVIHSTDITGELLKRIDMVCALFEKVACEDLRSVLEDEKANIINELNKQRLTPAAFSDDGLKNLKNFRSDVKCGIFDIEWPDFAERVIQSNGEDKEAFTGFVEFIQLLMEKYDVSSANEFSQNETSNEINCCLIELSKQIEKKLLMKIENIGEAKARIVLDYKTALNTGKAESIIEEYTDIKASTCQQSMQTGRFASNEIFDLVIVDETARANPLDLFIPLSFARKIVLVGDHRQLPHMLDSQVVKQLEAVGKEKLEFYKKSFFEILFSKLSVNQGNSPFIRTCSLTEQYRMVPEINDFVRDSIYCIDNDKSHNNVDLKCGLSVEEIELRKASIKNYGDNSLVWINMGREKGTETKGSSKSRICEAEEVINQVKILLRDNPSVNTVGIITFYSRQKEELERISSQRLNKEDSNKVEIGTVDAFQGKEYDAVFLSCVRCNTNPSNDLRKKVGFLNNENRLCVALSRGKNLLVAVGDYETVKDIDILKNYVEFCKSGKGLYKNAN